MWATPAGPLVLGKSSMDELFTLCPSFWGYCTAILSAEEQSDCWPEYPELGDMYIPERSRNNMNNILFWQGIQDQQQSVSVKTQNNSFFSWVQVNACSYGSNT